MSKQQASIWTREDSMSVIGVIVAAGVLIWDYFTEQIDPVDQYDGSYVTTTRLQLRKSA